jgi:Protein of unknown function (DUF2877)
MHAVAKPWSTSATHVARGSLPQLGDRLVLLSLATQGHLVPQGPFVADVHSVFARACNFALGDRLLTLATAAAAPAPMTLTLAAGAVPDLRACFAVGESLVCSDAGVARTSRTLLRLHGVARWRPPSPRLGAGAMLVGRRCEQAHEQRCARVGMPRGWLALDRSDVPRQLRRACRDLDQAWAESLVHRLVGWGEGLTPAGDDWLAGCLAALQVLAAGQSARRSFLRAFAAAIDTAASRTTPIAAAALRLAARGHHGATLLALRDALLGAEGEGAGPAEPDPQVATAMAALLSLGASSGADMALGLLTGIEAWAPP